MKKHMAIWTVSLFLVLGSASAGMAQQTNPDRPATREQMENVRKRVEVLKMWKLTKALDLDEKTSARLFPLLNRYDKKRFQLEARIRDDMRDLRGALNEKQEGRLKNILDRLEQNHTEMQATNDQERPSGKKASTS